jgi:hypothetical protein
MLCAMDSSSLAAPDPPVTGARRLRSARGAGSRSQRISPVELSWLARGLDQPDGRLPVFAQDGSPVPRRMIEAAIRNGRAERWFHNPLKPDWLVCRLTPAGRAAASTR